MLYYPLPFISNLVENAINIAAIIKDNTRSKITPYGFTGAQIYQDRYTLRVSERQSPFLNVITDIMPEVIAERGQWGVSQQGQRSSSAHTLAL